MGYYWRIIATYQNEKSACTTTAFVKWYFVIEKKDVVQHVLTENLGLFPPIIDQEKEEAGVPDSKSYDAWLLMENIF